MSTIVVPAREKLTADERAELTSCEAKIAAAEDQVLSSLERRAAALKAISNGRLWREEFDSFEDYCAVRHSRSGNWAFRQITYAEVVKNIIDVLPEGAEGDRSQLTERSSRLIGHLPADTQREIITAVVKKNGKVTPAAVREETKSVAPKVKREVSLKTKRNTASKNKRMDAATKPEPSGETLIRTGAEGKTEWDEDAEAADLDRLLQSQVNRWPDKSRARFAQVLRERANIESPLPVELPPLVESPPVTVEQQTQEVKSVNELFPGVSGDGPHSGTMTDARWLVTQWAMVPDVVPCRNLTTQRTTKIKLRFSDPWWRANYQEALDIITSGKTPFLQGKQPGYNGKTFKANLDWFVKPDSVLGIIEGKYSGEIRKTTSELLDEVFGDNGKF